LFSRATRRLVVETVQCVGFSASQCGTNLNNALANSLADELMLEDGSYTGVTFTIQRSVTLRAENFGQVSLDGERSQRVMDISSLSFLQTVVVYLYGLRIINGVGPGGGTCDPGTGCSGNGGGVRVGYGVLAHFRSCEISSNEAGMGHHGGGIYVSGTATFRDCDISYNRGDGGGIYVTRWASIDVDSCYIHHNTALNFGSGMGEGRGGGVLVFDGDAAFRSTTFEANSATRDGGGLYQARGDMAVMILAGSLALRSVIFINNQAEIGSALYWDEVISGWNVPQPTFPPLASNCTFSAAPTSMASMVVAATPFEWECHLGQHSPHIGIVLAAANFTGCFFQCPAGTFGAAINLTSADECTMCPIGHSCPGEGLTFGTPCAFGTYSPTPGAVACELCPRGSTTAITGATSINQCICQGNNYIVTFIQADGSTTATCTPCSSVLALSVMREGGSLMSDCVCERQHYYLASPISPNITDGTCVPCPPGIDCIAAGETLGSLNILPVYWRESNLSQTVRRCPIDSSGACVGGRNASVCAIGHTGPYCSLCIDGYSQSGVGALCTKCEGSVGLALAGPLTGIIAILLLVGYCCWRRRKYASSMRDAVNFTMKTAVGRAKSGMDENAAVAAMKKITYDEANKAAAGPGSKLKQCVLKAVAFVIASEVQVKILIATYQILNGIGDVFPIQFPNIYQICMDRVNAALGVLAIELPTIMPIACFGSWNFYISLLVSTVLPLVIIAVLGATGLSAKGKLSLHNAFRKDAVSADISATRNWLADTCFTINFFIMFIIYPSISQKIFRFFDCETLGGLGEDGRRYLRVDYSIDCDTNTHHMMTVVAIVLLGIYPFGIPCYFAYMLHNHRHDLVLIRHEEVRMLSEIAADKQAKMLRAKGAKGSKGLVGSLAADGRLSLQTAGTVTADQGTRSPETDSTLDVAQIRADDQKRMAAKIGKIEGLKTKHLDATVRKLLFGYEMRCYWFELYECARKLLLIGLPVFLVEYPTVQITF